MSAVSKVSLAQFFAYCFDNNLPVAIYRLPDNDEVMVIAQKDSSVQTTNAKGFLFAPFQEDKEYKKVIIAPDVFSNSNNLPKLNFSKGTAAVKEKEKIKLKETNKAQYEALVQKIKKEIRKKRFEKVIAARVIKKKRSKDFDSVLVFQNLCKKYPQAFVSLVYTPQYGLWIGASPEVLLNASKKEFKTYALAGTKANTPANVKAGWGNKEMEEHQIVSRYIAKAFTSVAKQKPTLKGPETVVAGNLLHLRTTFRYKAVKESLWQKAIEELHPTPAVAGLPKQEAIEFILKHENSPRGFYSGYLGPVNMESETNLFVNLRCMNVLKNKLAIYVGCGITADSVPKEEWNESKLKSKTLLSALS